MKKFIAFIFTALAFVGLAQPQKINYQGVAVGANGKAIKNASVGLRLSVLDSLPTGSTLYTETQSASTDAAGQFSIYLGAGTATLGTFANIPWANGNDKFLKVEMDAQGGTNYQNMGTTQLVSVPYALVSGAVRASNGQMYQLTIGSNGPTWTCYPPVTQASAGLDQSNICSVTVNLVGNVPNQGTVSWSLISGVGGSFGSSNVNSTTFSGIRGNSYSLRYSISNVCGSSADTVAVSLAPTATPANAGPDQLSLTGTTANLAANAPAAGETGTWTIISGSGASLNNANSPTTTLTKGTDSAYTLVWTITGSCGTSRDTVNLHFSVPAATVCGQSVTYAGETYPTVQIGTQCWFAKNLNVGTMILSGQDQTNNNVFEKYCYNFVITNCNTYGGLYQWAEAVQYLNGASNFDSLATPFTGNVVGICPTGWHLPNDAEWGSLITFLGGSFVAGGALKSTSGLWTTPNTGANNSSGFSALPSGYRFFVGASATYNYLGSLTRFWSSSENYTNSAIYYDLVNDFAHVTRSASNKFNGLSIRCIKD